MRFRLGFFILAGIIIATLIGGGVFIWYQGRGVSGLEIKLAVPAQITVGTPFDLQASVGNNSQSILQDAKIFIELPPDLVFVGSATDKNLDSKNLGDLGAGSQTQETFRVLALGGDSTVKEIKATITYTPGSLGSRFEKSASVNFSVVGQSVSFDLSMPQKVFSGQDFDTVITYKNISGISLQNLQLKLTYPPAFKFLSASLNPDFANNVWQLGDLNSNSQGKLTIRGQLFGPDNGFFEIKTSLSSSFLGKSYEISQKTASIAIEPSPLSINIILNNSSDYIIHLGEDLSYVINFTNNTDVALRDAIISARLTGEMFNLMSLGTNASLRASDNTLIWNAANTPLLAVISPGAGGSVFFTLKAKSTYPIKRLNDKNFTLKVTASIESPTVPYNVAAQKTFGVASSENKVGGQISIEAKALFRDANSGFLNNGPMPMRVGQPTNFTVHWLVRNYATDVGNIQVKSFLGGNVKITSALKSNGGVAPVYNDRTQEVVWTIDAMPATRGVLNAPLEAIFQVEATPAVNQVGSAVDLMQETSLSATDEFTGENLSDKAARINSTGLNDPTVTQQQGIVIP